MAVKPPRVSHTTGSVPAVLLWLLDTTQFLPRGQCGNWSDSLVVIYKSASVVIAISYWLIPVSLFALYRSQLSRNPHTWLTLAFALFITLCGLTHAMDFLSFYWPAYRLFTAVLIATAIVSFFTACATPMLLYTLKQRARDG